jgi:hypothetical protein
MNPKLHKLNSQSDQQEFIAMPRMRGQVVDSLVEPRKKDMFDRVIAIELEVYMKNIHGANMEEIYWLIHR